MSRCSTDFEHERDPPMNGLTDRDGRVRRAARFVAAGDDAAPDRVRAAGQAASSSVTRYTWRASVETSRRARSLACRGDRLRGGLEVQHSALFFADLRVIGPTRSRERSPRELRAVGAENRLVGARDGLYAMAARLYAPSPVAGRGQPAPAVCQGRVRANRACGRSGTCRRPTTFTLPCARSGVPVAPAPPAIMRPADGTGHAARRARPGLDPRADARAEHRRPGHGRAGQVELPGRDRRGGSAPRALRGDRARPQGRRRGGGAQRRAARSARARCSTSPSRRAASTRSRSTPRQT